MYNNFNLLLHKNLFHITKTSSSLTESCSPRTTERRKLRTIQELYFDVYSTIQRVSIHCIVGANDVGGLLSSVWCCHSGISYYWTSYPIYRISLGNNDSNCFVELFFGSIYLLLESQGDKTGRERNHLQVMLLLMVNVSEFLKERIKHRNMSFTFLI